MTLSSRPYYPKILPGNCPVLGGKVKAEGVVGKSRSKAFSVIYLEKKEGFVMNWRKRIVTNPKILVGKPIIKGTRISVEFLLGLIAQGWSEERILSNYPQLTPADLRACFTFAAEVIRDERVYPVHV